MLSHEIRVLYGSPELPASMLWPSDMLHPVVRVSATVESRKETMGQQERVRCLVAALGRDLKPLGQARSCRSQGSPGSSPGPYGSSIEAFESPVETLAGSTPDHPPLIIPVHLGSTCRQAKHLTHCAEYVLRIPPTIAHLCKLSDVTCALLPGR